jgi:hypothetical protein
MADNPCGRSRLLQQNLPGTDIGDAFEITRQGSRNSGSMSGKMPKNLTISRINPTKYWFFDFDCYLTNTDGFARGVSDELEQQRRFFDDTKPHS